MSTFSINVTGLNAAQMALVTTSHNIANASTPGYSRQRIVQANNNPMMTGSGALGQGTHVSTVERMYSRFLTEQVNRTQTNVSELDTFYSQISQIDATLADPNSGLSPAIQDFFTGLQQVAANPASVPARQSMVSAGESMVARFQSLEDRLDELAAGVNEQIDTTLDQVNSYAVQIADLNDRIVAAEGPYNQPANDLLDQRDQLVAELNKLVKVTTTLDTNGAYNVFVGSGQQLVVGSIPSSLVATPSSADPSRMVIGLRTIGGNVQEMPENLISGGQIGGLLRFRSEALDPAYNKLGAVAASMALTFNAQHGLGQDLLGQISGDAGFVANFFTLQAPRVVSNSNNTAGGPTVTATLTTPPPSNGTNFYTDLTNSDYTLSFDGTNLNLTRLSDNQVVASGIDITAINTALAANPQGFSLADSGAAYTTGDSYLIQPTHEMARNIDMDSRIVADPRLVAAAAPIRTSATLTNAGDAKITAPSVGLNYSVTGLPLTVTFNAGDLTGFPAGTLTVTTGAGVTTYPIGGPATTVPYTSGARYSFTAAAPGVDPSEFAFSMSGTPGNNDTFLIGRNSGALGVSDGSNALLLGKLQTQSTSLGGTATYQSAYAQLVSDNGNKTREIQVTGQAQQALLNNSQNSRDALSAVNLDEEAANLIRFQQAYQASAKALEISSKLLDSILAL